ncbi:MAG: ABC transporter permease [Lachnospiraceae bacterium]|jgi:ABC-type dipeptide/oligopeptide/nickel transport system permease component
MIKFVLKRLLATVIIVVLAAFLIFSMLYITPANPADALLGANATLEDKAALEAKLGLDKPYIVQLGVFMYKTFIKFDFGNSWTFGTPVFKELADRMPYTLVIGVCAMVINLTLGLLLGIFAGVHAGRWQDSVVMGLAMILIAAPNFWVALLMIVLFSAKLHWLPPYGIDSWQCYIMPIIASAITGIAVNARFGRNSIVEVLRADYITTARAKGLKERAVIYKHMLPNALMPTITNIGKILGAIIAGSPVIEAIFSIPGVGMYMLTAINTRDYPVVRACVLFFAVMISLIMLLVDLAYAAVDPRIKAKFSSGGR